MYCVAFKKGTRVQHIYCMLFSGRKTSGEKVLFFVFCFFITYFFIYLSDFGFVFMTGKCERLPAVGRLQEGQHALSSDWSVRRAKNNLHVFRCSFFIFHFLLSFADRSSSPAASLSSHSGHEFPFSIQMNHVRHAAFQRRDASTPPADRKAALQGERPQVCKQCQFILKPRPTETPTVSAGELEEYPFIIYV